MVELADYPTNNYPTNEVRSPALVGSTTLSRKEVEDRSTSDCLSNLPGFGWGF
jgi:hypothetical protein